MSSVACVSTLAQKLGCSCELAMLMTAFPLYVLPQVRMDDFDLVKKKKPPPIMARAFLFRRGLQRLVRVAFVPVFLLWKNFKRMLWGW